VICCQKARAPANSLTVEQAIRLCILIVALALLAGCGAVPGPATEEVRKEPNKAVYRSADENGVDAAPTIAPHQKIPGE
jgi:hypothetical protein